MLRLTKIKYIKRLSYQQHEQIDDIMDSSGGGKLNQAQERSFDGQLDKKRRLREKPSKLNNLEKRSDLTVHKMSLKKKQPIKQPGRQTRNGVKF